MNIKQTVKTLVVSAVMMGAFVGVLMPAPASAVTNNGCETDTAIIKCSGVTGSGKVEETGLWSVLLTAINILTAGIGIAAVAGVIYASILYTSAGGSAEQTKKAMGIITNIVIGVIAYALMYALLNFIIPGGLFTS
jgi:hypothetical protein